jgi:hypothetical protein
MKLCMLTDCRARAVHKPCESPALALFAPTTATIKDASSPDTSGRAPEHQGTRTPRHLQSTWLHFVAPPGSTNFFACIVVLVARWAQPVTLFELRGRAVHVVASLPLGVVVVVAAHRASPVPLLPFLLVIDRHRKALHRYEQISFRFDIQCAIVGK